MKLLITGGSGFIGRNLAEQFRASCDVAAPGRAELDLLDAEAVRDYLERQRFDAVIHAATERSNRAVNGAPDLVERNCRMFFNLARNSHAFGRMLFLSSGAVYDRAHWRPRMPEEYFDTYVPADGYGFSKYLCARALADLERVCELRLFGVFGPHEDWRVRFLSNACCRAVWDLPVVIRQDVCFDYLDVADLGRILSCFLVKNLRRRQYNICTGQALHLTDLAERVLAVSGKRIGVQIRNSGLAVEYSGDNRLMLSEIPGFQFRGVDESIACLYRWYEGRKAAIDPDLLHFDE